MIVIVGGAITRVAPDVDAVTGAHYGRKLLRRAAARTEDVADWLISLPPRSVLMFCLNHAVLIWRRHLHVIDSIKIEILVS